MDLAVLAILLLASSDAIAQVARATIDPSAVWLYVWLAIMGVVGGIVNFHQKVKAGATRWLNINELIGELFTSGFVGVITGLLAQAAEFGLPLTFALVGITGHMGGRAIFLAEKVMQRWLEKKLGVLKDADSYAVHNSGAGSNTPPNIPPDVPRE